MGLFAEHVVIPIRDGEEAGKDFARLLNEVHEEFQPEPLLQAPGCTS
jgi:hypothetical protein